MRGGDGRIVGTIGFALALGSSADDWSARRSSARRYRAVVSSAPVGVAVLTLDGQVLECNAALARILDYSAREICRRGIAGLSHPDDLMLDVHLFSELIEGRRDRYQIEKRCFRRDGSLVWCNLTVSLVRSDSGAPELVVAVVDDVSERKEAVQALRASEAKFRGVYESGMLGVVFFDVGGAITDANDAFLEMLGYRREDLSGAGIRWKDLTPGEFAGVDQQALAEMAARGVSRPYEKEFLRSDGTRVPVLAGGALFEGQRDGVSFVLDMREKRRLEAQFHHAQRLEVVGRLAGGVAHDFNNLLTVVLGSAEQAAITVDKGSAAAAYLAQIQEAGTRAAQLTKQLLAFGRRQIMQPRVFDLDDLVRRIEALLRRVIREDITLVTDLGAAGARVRADPGMLEQVLMNLVVNARDAIRGSGTIQISTRREATVCGEGIRSGCELAGPCVWISVRDSGSGMDPETLAHVFEPFFTTKGPGVGTGLGLAIVHGVVQQSGGGIRVDSAPGAGSTFEIVLPETSEPAAAEAPPLFPRTARGSETLLVVEDDLAVLDVTSGILAGLGYQVIATNGPAQALSASDRHEDPIHMVVSDLVMPGMGGTELASRVRNRHPEAKVLFLSGYAGEAISAAASPEVAGALLAKPFTRIQLALKIREILEARPGGRLPS
jgi:PAS domain S-box-containing protein